MATTEPARDIANSRAASARPIAPAHHRVADASGPSPAIAGHVGSFRIIAAAAIVIILAAGAWRWHAQVRHQSTWQGTAEWVLRRGAQTTGLEMSPRTVSDHEPVPIPDQDGLEPVPGRIYWLAEVDGRGDVRLGVDLTWSEVVDGFELMVAAPRTQPPHMSMTQPGYACQFGGYRGTQTYLVSSPVAGWQRPSPIAHPFQAGRTYRLELERRGEHLRLRVDGTMIWEQRELIPVGDSQFRWLALRAWSAVRIHRIFVDKPVAEPPMTPLSTADAFAAAGYHADALAAYRSALQGSLPAKLREQAVATCYLLASRLPDMAEVRRKFLEQAEHDFDESSLYLRDVLEAEAIRLWTAREWTAAVRLAERLQRRFPESRSAVQLLERRNDAAPEGILAETIQLASSGPPVSHLNLAGLGLSSLTPLAGMRNLESLDISGNRISDLKPLAGMRLKRLVCSSNLISDLAPLHGMPLLQFEASYNRITDIAALRGAPLERLVLIGNGITDLAPISGMPLATLYMDANPVASLEPLRGCTRLGRLTMSDATFTDLSPLPLAALAKLTLVRCPVSDITPLASSQLKQLDLSGTQVTDLSTLPRTDLRHLNLSGTPVTSLASLRGMTLSTLNLSRCPLTSLDGIGGINLVQPLQLHLDGTTITSLDPLDATNIQTLSVRDSRIGDLTPLAGRTITTLLADGIPVQDLQPIRQIAGLKRLTLWRTGNPQTLDALADTMERLAGRPEIATTLRIHAALAARDWRRLQAMARRLGTADRLPLQMELPFTEALALASEAGARLPCPVDLADLRAIANAPIITERFWVGLLPQSGSDEQPRWMNGQATSRLAMMMRPGPTPFRGHSWACPPTPNDTQLQAFDDQPATTSQVVLEW